MSQLEYSIYISTIAVTLLNFGSRAKDETSSSSISVSLSHRKVSFIAAAAFTVLAILSLMYAVVVYLYRSQAIRERRVARYYDKWGPSALCFALLVAVGLNFGLEGRKRGVW